MANNFKAVEQRAFLDAYRGSQPVGVLVPNGGLYGVVGFLMHDDGISFMDDAYLDPMPTRHANHHVPGAPALDGGSITLREHRFVALEGEVAGQWRRMFDDRSPGQVRRSSEKLLLQIYEERARGRDHHPD